MSGFVFSLLVLFIGFAALAVHFLRHKSKDRTLLWFGLFVGLYGLRSASRHLITRMLVDAPPIFWSYLDSVITDVIVTPALLFFEASYGQGWRSSLRWLFWTQAAWGAAAIAADLISGTPGRFPDPSNLLLIALPLLLVMGHIRGYRPPESAWATIIFVGGAIFVLSVMVDRMRDAGLTPWKLLLEPIGFLANLACLGYVAAQRFITNEQQLVAIDAEMKSAARIQASILPHDVPRVPGFDIAVRYIPMTAVAGDFFDFLAPGGSGVGILVADVTGHGVPAALVASMVKVASSSQNHNAGNPAQVITAINQVMCRQVQGQFTTAGCLYLDVAKRHALYAAAGHPPLLLWRKTAGSLREFRDNGLLLGVRSNEEYRNTAIDLEPGDRLLLYTDGVPEASNGAEEFFGEERLAEFISAHRNSSANGFADSLLATLAEWSGRGSRGSQSDDITLVVIDVRPAQQGL